MRTTTAYVKFEILEAIRIPALFIGLLFMPVGGMLVFVIPTLGSDPATATMGTASMCLFTVLIICSAQYGMGIADSRTKPWGGYVRTLPGGPLPKMISMVTLSMLMTLLGTVPLVLLAVVATRAEASLPELLLGVGALLLAVIPFALFMLAVGYSVTPTLVPMLSGIAPLPLVFLGGLLADPRATDGFIGTIAPFVPVRGSAELVWAAVSDYSPRPVSLISQAGWIVVLGLIAYRAYRADEGQRFR
ncbi:ABC transporter permease [Streptomyces sp. ACA25]|uniref:ABC transporter permease n=1 Tax=Streptomyces sp. ACA25 TaxID=3022596 RepID=UPI002307FDEE|nr:ABC transporter permease [Streptomyces sp. ACA25]MDB1090152.1 ABC transporter permease [Streptomyces sp. ACA25]